MALGAFLALGGLEIVFASLMATFTLVPAGSFAFGEAPLDVLIGLLQSGFDLALRVSMPVLAIIWALIDRSRWATVILGVAAITVAVMLYRMQQIWFVQVYTPVV